MSFLYDTLRSWLVRAPRAQRVDLRGQRAIVTGATPGSLGFETARLLAAWGADVVVSTRRAPETAAAQLRQQLASVPGHGRVEALALDLCERDSVEHFVARYRERHDALELLVNNAGVHLDLLSQWQAPQLTADGHEIHWRTNYLGTMHLTHRLLPLLQRAGGARVVNVVSQLHVKGSNAGLFAPQPRYNSWVAYGNSKLALVHATFELQRRYAHHHGVQAYCLHPGAVYTHIADGGLAGNPAVERLRRAFAPVEAFFLLTPEEGAQTSLHCASAADAEGGRYYRACRVAEPSADSRDAAVSARLWQDTADWVEPDRAF
ncbi:MAG: SDR family NAD(P)-dependent oxidoreductase [Nevskiaceae bacterium]|nr:MAG: SDR family NAD(P)-dependent oxidoreductase [Nevskiaceae bacterium]